MAVKDASVHPYKPPKSALSLHIYLQIPLRAASRLICAARCVRLRVAHPGSVLGIAERRMDRRSPGRHRQEPVNTLLPVRPVQRVPFDAPRRKYRAILRRGSQLRSRLRSFDLCGYWVTTRRHLLHRFPATLQLRSFRRFMRFPRMHRGRSICDYLHVPFKGTTPFNS